MHALIFPKGSHLRDILEPSVRFCHDHGIVAKAFKEVSPPDMLDGSGGGSGGGGGGGNGDGGGDQSRKSLTLVHFLVMFAFLAAGAGTAAAAFVAELAWKGVVSQKTRLESPSSLRYNPSRTTSIVLEGLYCS